jgi:hypothetical protein
MGITLERIKHEKRARRTLSAEKRRQEADLFLFSLDGFAPSFAVFTTMAVARVKGATAVSQPMDDFMG